MARHSDKNTDVPGNSVASHAAYVRTLVRQAETLMDAERVADRMFEADVLIRSVSIRFPTDDRPGYLAVVRVFGGGANLVGFHDAPTFGEVVIGLLNRLSNGSLVFKEDKYE